MPTGVVRFGDFELDPGNFLLLRRGRAVKLERTPMELLVLLAEAPGRLVTQQEAVERIWGKGVHIAAASSLYTAVRKLRHALGEKPGKPRFIETVPRKGYRFVAPVTSTGPASTRKMLAVLPLENLGGHKRQEYFSDGLTEELITELARLSPAELGVIARTSVMRYKRSRQTARQIGEALGADYLVEGSVRRERARVRITVQLIRVRDQSHLWAETYERSLGDLLPLQAEIALTVAGAIRLQLAPAAEAVAALNPEMHDLYLRARYLWSQRTSPSIRQAITHFQTALQLDPAYAPAWAGLSMCYAVLPITADAPPSQVFPQGRDAAARALHLDPTLPEAHVARGVIHLWSEWDWTAAEQHFRRAIAANPSDSDAHMFLAHLFSDLGKHEQALAEIRIALRLDPVSAIVNTHEGHFLYSARRYQEALAPLQRALQLAPQFWVAHIVLGKVLAMTKNYPQALAAFRRAHRCSHGNTEALALRAYTLAVAGQTAAARRVLRDLQRRAARFFVPPLHRALAHLGLGEHKTALDELERAFQERDVRLTFLAVEPRWDPLRAHSRFRALLRRVGLLMPRS